MAKVETVYEPTAEWVVEWLKKPEMEILRITEIAAPNEALAVLFSLRFLTGEGFDINKDNLTHIKTERIN